MVKEEKMTTLSQIKQEQLQARKDKNMLVASLLTTLIGEIQGDVTRLAPEARTDKAEGDIVMATIKSFLKKNKEAQDNVKDSVKVDELKQEEVILLSYLPTQLSKEQLAEVIRGNFPEITAKSKGAIMGYLKQNYQGQYDGKLASDVISELTT